MKRTKQREICYKNKKTSFVWRNSQEIIRFEWQKLRHMMIK